MMGKSETSSKSSHPFLEKLKDSFQNVRDFNNLCKEMDEQAEAEIAEIQRDTERYKQKMAAHTEDQLKQMDIMAEKLKLGLEEKDPAFVQSQIDAMLALMNKTPDIEQEISDEKLKSAN